MTDLSSSEICQPAQAQTLVVIPHFPVYETARFPGIHRTDPSWIGSTRGRSPGSRNDGDLTTEILQPDLRDVDPVHQDLTLAGLEDSKEGLHQRRSPRVSASDHAHPQKFPEPQNRPGGERTGDSMVDGQIRHIEPSIGGTICRNPQAFIILIFDPGIPHHSVHAVYTPLESCIGAYGQPHHGAYLNSKGDCESRRGGINVSQRHDQRCGGGGENSSGHAVAEPEPSI